MLGAVIFDFDGVITDSEILHFRAFNAVLSDHGLELAKKEYYAHYLGLNDKDCFKTLIGEGRLGIKVSQIGELIRRKTLIFEELARTDGKIIEGVRPFLDMLASNAVPMAICSGALRAEIELILDDSGLRDFFRAIVSAEQVKRGKPHPEGFLLTLRKLSERLSSPMTAKQCIVVEDSHWGLKAAQAAGMHTVAVTNTYDADQLASAEKIVERLDSLTLADLTQLCRPDADNLV
ncbi:MAG: HAD family phosphatase [Sedimentisphaerales bacterium]|jgi:beta-phosphoglucomutase|nr:HAD family phosphatase [Planctomycetota bacterium]MDY0354680.1 HAD family phosphatase [Sedimentisphaerales bacterium]NLT76816.1 HAD family phosphatase [Planctomycetota bacterium]